MGADNQVIADATYTYAYDKQGNLIEQDRKDGTQAITYTWDYRDRLTDVTTRDGSGHVVQSVHYTYDAANDRIGKTVTDGQGNVTLTEHYVYDRGNLLLVLDGGGNVTGRYLSGLAENQVLAEETAITNSGAGQVHWTLTDQEGSIRDVVDNGGHVLDHIVYSSYGAILSQTNAAALTRMAYTGQVWDGEVGLYYDHARYYDPRTGRFLGQDPSGFAAGDGNLYRYVGNNPASATDPSGLCSVFSSSDFWKGLAWGGLKVGMLLGGMILFPELTVPLLLLGGLGLGSDFLSRELAGQPDGEALLGSLADLTGINGVYEGITGYDGATGNYLNLSPEQRGEAVGGGLALLGGFAWGGLNEFLPAPGEGGGFSGGGVPEVGEPAGLGDGLPGEAGRPIEGPPVVESEAPAGLGDEPRPVETAEPVAPDVEAAGEGAAAGPEGQGEGMPIDVIPEVQREQPGILDTSPEGSQNSPTGEGNAEAAPQATTPGMTGGYKLPSDIANFAERFEPELNQAIANRMQEVGVPDEMIGLVPGDLVFLA